MPEARVSRRAGRGNSASPVRRGESGPRSCVAFSPTLPARSATARGELTGRLVKPIHIIGGGLAGPEAAWQIARRGLRCVLYEMRPVRPTPAHQADRLAELVCS